MNKRFSTLLAAALVAGGVSASAQTTLKELLEVGDQGYVTLGCGASDEYLSIADGKFDFDQTDFENLTDVKKAFEGVWQMTINEAKTVDGVPTFTFVNKATGMPFAVQLVTNNKGTSTEVAAYADGGNTDWGYEPSLGLYHIAGDSVFYFSENKLCAIKGKLVDALNETPTDPIAPKAADELEFDITPDIFNYLVGKDGKLHFNGGKDVVGTGNVNILTAKAWKASSADANSSATATNFMLSSTKDSSKIKTPMHLVVDTAFYGRSATTQLNKLAIDSIAGTFVYGANGALTYTAPANTYEEVKDKAGKVVALKPRFPQESAIFTGKYYLANDSIALYAANSVTVKAVNVPAADAKYTSNGSDFTSLDLLKDGAKGQIDAAADAAMVGIVTMTLDATDQAESSVELLGKTYAVKYDAVGSKYVYGSEDVTGTNVNDVLSFLKGKAKADAKVELEADIATWEEEKDNESTYSTITISATYTPAVEASSYREITATTATPGDGLIALKYLTDRTLVLTPNFKVTGMTGTNAEDVAKANDFILPLIQSGFTAAVAGNDYSSENDGLYVITNGKGQYLAAPIYNTVNGATSIAKWVTVNASLQEVKHMPAYQWVVLKDKNYSDAVKKTSPVTIANREFASLNASVQLNKKAGAANSYVSAAALGMAAADSLKFIQIKDLAILSDTLLGYKNFEKDSLLVNRYTFNYLHEYAKDKYIVKSAKDSLAKATDGTLAFKVEKVNGIYDYGFKVTKEVAERIAGLKQLRRQAYKIYIPTVKGDLYLCENTEHQYMFTATPSAADKVATLLFKEENDLTNNKHYHALLAVEQSTATWGALATETYTKVGVSDETVILKDQEMDETRTSTFFIGKYDAPLYRRFNSLDLEGNEGDAADTLRFKEKYRGEYLQIEANPNFTVKGIDFLGIYTPDFTKDGKSFIVDTAWVNRGQGEIKPQYLISIDREDQKFEAGERCPVCQALIDAGKQPVENCPHDKAGVSPFHLGKYLVNFADSVANTDYAWKGYTRAGFVKAAHMGDSLYILKDQFADVTVATFDTAKIHKAVKDGKYAAANIRNLRGDAHKTVTWSMRFVNPEVAANENEDDRAFLMESLAKNPADMIAPINGQWLKMQNGCIVLSGSMAGSTSSFDQITNADDALIFTIEEGNADDIATDNETIATSEVAVIAGEGQVTIAGAAGKKVVISNILGQVVANTVVASDNAVIAAPQGVVVVAVEGEEAVKAIVK